MESGLTPGVPEHDAFNASLLCCLPKKPVREEQDGTQVYEPKGTRPLSITNTNNRIIANAYRLRLEPLLALRVTPDQRGFLPGRPMLKNIIDIEHAATTASL